MIPVLYKANSTNFDTFGIGVLKDCTSCEVTEERNGAYECILKYPITGTLYKEICTERLVKAKPNDTAKDQVFRIYRISTPINGQITVYAQHRRPSVDGRLYFSGTCYGAGLSEYCYAPQLHLSDRLLDSKAIFRFQTAERSCLPGRCGRFFSGFVGR